DGKDSNNKAVLDEVFDSQKAVLQIRDSGNQPTEYNNQPHSCDKCGLTVPENGEKVIVRNNLKPQLKRDMEEGKKNDPKVGELGNKLIETIESDVYPNRKRNRQI
ncbi:2419_t:CDS:2, partial [Scutellospora calospora]